MKTSYLFGHKLHKWTYENKSIPHSLTCHQPPCRTRYQTASCKTKDSQSWKWTCIFYRVSRTENCCCISEVPSFLNYCIGVLCNLSGAVLAQHIYMKLKYYLQLCFYFHDSNKCECKIINVFFMNEKNIFIKKYL